MVWVFQQVPGSGITLSIWGVLRSVSFAGGAMHAPWRAAEQSSWAQTHSFLGCLRCGWDKGMIVTCGQHLGEGRKMKRQVKPLWVVQWRGEAVVAEGRG